MVHCVYLAILVENWLATDRPTDGRRDRRGDWKLKYQKIVQETLQYKTDDYA